MYEPVDKVLKKLSNNQRFKEYLLNTCELNNVNVEAVKKCMGGLYHTSSKGLHVLRQADLTDVSRQVMW